MEPNWYIGRNKQKFGPFSTTQLQQLATLGLVKPSEFVLQEGAQKWVAAATIAGLFPAAEGPKKFWLSLGGKTQGPYRAEQIQVSLMRRQVPGETLACREGEKEWVALARRPEFRACVPAAVPKSSHAQLGLGSSHVDLTEEEAELHLAGKQGDLIAALLSTLLDMKRRNQNSSLKDIIDRNIQDLKAIRERGAAGLDAGRGGPLSGSHALAGPPGFAGNQPR